MAQLDTIPEDGLMERFMAVRKRKNWHSEDVHNWQGKTYGAELICCKTTSKP